MKRIGIRVKQNVDPLKVKNLAEWIESKGIKTVTISNRRKNLPKGLDLLIVMGGDGTLLGGARMAAREGIPVLGIDFGGLGFLSEIKYKDFKKSLALIFNGKHFIEERVMMEADISCGKKINLKSLPAVNDIVITKNSGRMLQLKVSINDQYFTEFPGDGLIVSTATGSTAYSLSAGGPIVSPQLNVFLLTSICPHTLLERSLVTSGDDIIRVQLPEKRDDLVLIIDGQEEYNLLAGSEITIRRTPYLVGFVRVKPSRFFETVRKKFHTR